MNPLHLPFIAQGVAMAVDEFHFHRKRSLPLWERIGHPLDSLSVLACYLWLLNGGGFAGYVTLCAFSCLLVTKDEFVHARECGAGEQWLHALLFVLHPVLFLCAWLLWRDSPTDPVLLAQPWLVGAFLLFQVVRWGVPWRSLR